MCCIIYDTWQTLPCFRGVFAILLWDVSGTLLAGALTPRIQPVSVGCLACCPAASSLRTGKPSSNGETWPWNQRYYDKHLFLIFFSSFESLLLKRQITLVTFCNWQWRSYICRILWDQNKIWTWGMFLRLRNLLPIVWWLDGFPRTP